jgi:hypothetical protein
MISLLSPSQGLEMGLSGCLRNLQHDGTEVGAPDRIVKTEACSANTETGTFFGADGGYVQLGKRKQRSQNFSRIT